MKNVVSNLCVAASAGLTVLIQGYFIVSTDQAMFSSVPITAGYILLLALGTVASYVFLAANLMPFFRDMSDKFLTLLFFALMPLAFLWTLSAFMQWNTELLRWLVALVVLVAALRLVQWTVFEPDGVSAFEPPTGPDETLAAV